MPPPPPPSSITTTHLSSSSASQPAQRQRPKSPNRVLAEAEAQWLFTDAELANTPSIQDGMSQAEEKEIRAKGVNFIVQVGIMLKLPQLTLSTASVFFQRFLMRASLKKERNGIPKLHHYQTAATALFLATKVEESCRKMKEMILAFCRVAQKNPNLLIDEQSKDWWRWRDCILHNEDVLLEVLCFDLTVESPHRQLFEMLKYYGIEHNKRLRNAAWGFVTDSNNTQLCLLCSSRTIAVASLYAACRYCSVTLPDDHKGRPWWEAQQTRLKDIRSAVEYMLQNYDHAANKVNGIAASGGSAAGSDGHGSIYLGLSTPGIDGHGGGDGGWDSTRRREDPPGSASPFASDRRHSNASSVVGDSGAGKREHEDGATNGGGGGGGGGGDAPYRDEHDLKRSRLDQLPDRDADAPLLREEALRVQNGNRANAADAAAEDIVMRDAKGTAADDAAEGSEEGELEE